ncbi:MAG: outer membrane protein assembly factor BamA [Verrucomicrobiales bacterium]|nr:outer membrane protein assembly factor BamA [Verrucomicrobiales bacterium]
MFPPNSRCRAWLGVLLACCLLAPAVLAQLPELVKEIEIQHMGPPAVSDSLVRSNLRVKVGDSYSRNAVNTDIETLYGTGYFYNIRVDPERVDGGIKLRYVLIGKPTLTQITFEGNTKFSDGKLQKKLKSKVGEPLDEQKLHADAQEIVKLYQKKGYRQTKVEYVPVVDSELGKGTVTFQVAEAAKVKIDDVVFVGAEAFSQRKLRGVLKTRRHWFLSWLTGSGVLKDEVFAEDHERLADFYREAGYIDFEIRDIEFEHPKSNRMIIKITLREGLQYRVGRVEFEGNELFPTEQIRDQMQTREKNRWIRGLQMGPGQVFTPSGLSKDRQAVQDFYGARGYIDARVVANLHPNTAQGTMDITYRLTEGKESFIERIDIKGNTKTKDRVIRRELAVSPGEVFDMVSVNLSTNRLYGLQYFSRVDAQAEPTDVPDRKNLVLTVEEKSTGDVRFGAGFSSLDELVGFVELTQGNADIFKQPLFFGTGAGQKLRLIAQVGTARRDIQFTFIEPWFLGRKLALGFDAYYRNLLYYSDVYDIDLIGGRLTLTRSLWNDYWRGMVGYSLYNVGIVNVEPTASPEILAEAGHTLVSKPIGKISYDSRNSVLLPNHGQLTELEAGFAGGPFGGQTDYYSWELNTSHYFPGLFDGHVLEIIARGGVMDNWGSDTHIPMYDRWSLGGLFSMRGYEYRSVGPYDSLGQEPLGGRTYWFASAEYSVPVIQSLRLAAFYDIGNVYPDPYSFERPSPDYGPYSDNYGVGIRLNIPGMGPLRLDYAIPIQHDRFVSGDGRFQFSVGYTRSGY